VLDSGLSAAELQIILREAIVRSAASKQLQGVDRINISGIAATTGIPRGDVSNILKSRKTSVHKANDTQHQSTNRILAAWHDDPRYTGADGQPADLALYGRKASFESLARKYGLGIPTRAVLDELVRAGAIELLSGQKIRAKMAMAVERGMSPRVIKAFGDRGSELLSTMLLNMRQPHNPRFIANVSESSVSPNALPLFKKELGVMSADFLAEIQERLNRKPVTHQKTTRQRTAAISVTVFYHETLASKKHTRTSTSKRRNFKRDSNV
jgi:Family of unknown function (DUF6502)